MRPDMIIPKLSRYEGIKISHLTSSDVIIKPGLTTLPGGQAFDEQVGCPEAEQRHVF